MPIGENARIQPEQKKLKYFGRVLPPKCEYHGCFQTDDGVHFYCTNMACNKHKHRRSKHTKYARHSHMDTRRAAERSQQAGSERASEVEERVKRTVPNAGFWPVIHFKCPSCGSMDIQMRILQNRYTCNGCDFEWK